VASKNLHVVQGGSSARRSLRILIADDERDTGLTLATILRDEGHEVNVVLRGDEVMQVERLLRPDALILDIDMPGMSGYAIARQIREYRGPLAPLLIAISGKWTKTSDQLVGKAVGFDHYLLKPCEPREVIGLLEPLRASSSGAASR
jgi:DNA-binding response OmpR family regulator